MLRFTVSIVFPPLRGLTPSDRAAVQATKRRTAAELRQAMNEVRKIVRAEAPRRTGALARSARVRRVRAAEPGAITYELVLGKFYGRFTNAEGRTRGWWTDAIGDPHQHIRDIGNRAAREVGAAFLRSIRDRFLREVAGSFARIGRVSLLNFSGRGASLNALGSFRL